MMISAGWGWRRQILHSKSFTSTKFTKKLYDLSGDDSLLIVEMFTFYGPFIQDQLCFVNARLVINAKKFIHFSIWIPNIIRETK